MNAFIKTIFLLFLAVISFTACEKQTDTICTECEDGIDGEDGMDGKDGEDGKDGNANVTGLEFTISSTDWEDVGDPGSSSHRIEIKRNLGALTPEIVNDGLVLVYFKSDGAIGSNPDPTHYVQLPYVVPSDNYTQVFSASYRAFELFLSVEATDNYATHYSGTVKVVLATADGFNIPPDLDLEKYEEVAAYFDL